MLDQRARGVLPLVHHEDAIRPEQQVAGEGHGRERRGPRGAHLVARIVRVEVLRRAAPVDVGGADEQDPLARSRGFLRALYPGRAAIESARLAQSEGHEHRPAAARGREPARPSRAKPARRGAGRLREEIARERRARRARAHGRGGARAPASEAETLREVLEAINRQARLDEHDRRGAEAARADRGVRLRGPRSAVAEPGAGLHHRRARRPGRSRRIVGTTLRRPAVTHAVRDERWPVTWRTSTADGALPGHPGSPAGALAGRDPAPASKARSSASCTWTGPTRRPLRGRGPAPRQGGRLLGRGGDPRRQLLEQVRRYAALHGAGGRTWTRRVSRERPRRGGPRDPRRSVPGSATTRAAC